jgi:hypothetical protein
VFVPPLPSKLPIDSFEGMSLELQEAAVIEDILFVLMATPNTRKVLMSRASKDNTSASTPINTTTKTKLIDSPAPNSKSPLASIQVSVI